MRLSAGVRVSLYPIDEDRALLVKHPKDPVRALKGLGKEIWKSLGGVDAYIRNERDSWKA